MRVCFFLPSPAADEDDKSKPAGSDGERRGVKRQRDEKDEHGRAYYEFREEAYNSRSVGGESFLPPLFRSRVIDSFRPSGRSFLAHGLPAYIFSLACTDPSLHRRRKRNREKEKMMKPSSSWTPVRTPIVSRWCYLGGFEVLPAGVVSFRPRVVFRAAAWFRSSEKLTRWLPPAACLTSLRSVHLFTGYGRAPTVLFFCVCSRQILLIFTSKPAKTVTGANLSSLRSFLLSGLEPGALTGSPRGKSALRQR